MCVCSRVPRRNIARRLQARLIRAQRGRKTNAHPPRSALRLLRPVDGCVLITAISVRKLCRFPTSKQRPHLCGGRCRSYAGRFGRLDVIAFSLYTQFVRRWAAARKFDQSTRRTADDTSAHIRQACKLPHACIHVRVFGCVARGHVMRRLRRCLATDKLTRLFVFRSSARQQCSSNCQFPHKHKPLLGAGVRPQNTRSRPDNSENNNVNASSWEDYSQLA